ncbi:MAG: homocysteine S-methyltransferase family protein [Planctomycetota bacterium]|nr:homocysteine S-methyltransferase family protein [Planctomycetota bacterium]
MSSALSRTLILDGATGTELNRRGVDTSLPLWSARALIEAPDTLRAIHADYLRAGAAAITTNTFRTHPRSLAHADLADEAPRLTALAVQIARAARDEVRPDALILGSVAPLEDCYEPALSPTFSDCRAEHAELIANLARAGVDLLLVETMNTIDEARAAAIEAESAMPGRWILSCVCDHASTTPSLLSGESLADLIRALDADLPRGARSPVAFGVNCVAAPQTLNLVRALRNLVPESVAIAAYANVGHPDPIQGWTNTDAVDPLRYAEYARLWRDAGASIIGGCCGTSPATIAALATALSAA